MKRFATSELCKHISIRHSSWPSFLETMNSVIVIFSVIVIGAHRGSGKAIEDTSNVNSSVDSSTTISSTSTSEIIQNVPTASSELSSIITTDIVSTASEQIIDSTTVASHTSENTNLTFIDKLSGQIRMLLKHFQDPEPMGLPGQTILPEPLLVPNTSGSLVIVTGQFYNISVYGLSNFTVEELYTDLDRMEVHAVLRIKEITVLGNYSAHNWAVDSDGPFTVKLYNVTADGIVALTADDDGKLLANKSETNMSYEKIEIDIFDASNLLKPFINGAGSSILDSSKPAILQDINTRLLYEINEKLEPFPKIPSIKSYSPVDLAILEGRMFVKKKYEPFVLTKFINHDSAFLKLNVGNITVYGLSRFARVGNVTLYLANGTIHIDVRIITSKLRGSCKWYYDIGKVGITRLGESNFTVEHLQFEALVKQPLDSRKSPILDDLQLETGPITIKMDGNGSFDYIVELVAKMIPSMLRYLIIDALEVPLKNKIQSEVLDKINVDQILEENMDDIKNYLSEKIR